MTTKIFFSMNYMGIVVVIIKKNSLKKKKTRTQESKKKFAFYSLEKTITIEISPSVTPTHL